MKYIKPVMSIVGIGLAAVWILTTPWICKYAASQRIIPGLGGELFWPFLPLLVWQVGKTLCDVFKSEEEEDEEESIHKG